MPQSNMIDVFITETDDVFTLLEYSDGRVEIERNGTPVYEAIESLSVGKRYMDRLRGIYHAII